MQIQHPEIMRGAEDLQDLERLNRAGLQVSPVVDSQTFSVWSEASHRATRQF